MKLLKTAPQALCMALAAVSCLRAANAVQELRFFDAAGNMLFKVAYEYDNNGNNTTRTVYDRGDYVLKRITFNADTNRYFDPFDNLLFRAGYTAASGGESFAFHDRYQKGSLVHSGSYSGSPGSYEFSDAGGGKTHSLSYQYDSDNRITQIDVKDAGGALTHYVMVYYVGDQPIRHAAGPRASISSLRVAGDRVRMAVSLTGKQRVQAQFFDVLGKLVHTALDRNMPGGYHTASLSPGPAQSVGVYLLRVTAGDVRVVKKVQVVR
ncbi:MAG: hypothetical protein GF418_13490 [Chitinivibrionales bacterium]|nr:hypothetical protein [Chitinivibrionales bacterium]MBD3396633.1 hypothetical protein [Chitinivibrionales bacterium]